MAKIDVPAEEDTGGIARLPQSAEPPYPADPTGELVIKPVGDDDLAERGLTADGTPLPASANGSRPARRRRTNGVANGSPLNGSYATTPTSPPLDPALFDDAVDSPIRPDGLVDIAGEMPAPTGAPIPVGPTDVGQVEQAAQAEVASHSLLGTTELVARTPPLRPYIEDPTGPVYSPSPFDPRSTVGETTILPIAPVMTDPAVPAAIPAPTIRAGIRLRRRPRPRVRRVRRVIRSIDTWTVFKVSLIFYMAMYVIFLVASVLLWRVANATGTLDNIQTFLTHYGWDSFKFRGGEIYHAVWIIGLFLVVAGIGLNVTMATLFNLIADLVGGIRVTVLEEEVRLRPRLQITKAIVPRPAKVAPTPGEQLVMPDSPPLVQPVDATGDLPRDLTSEILWIAPSSEVTETM